MCVGEKSRSICESCNHRTIVPDGSMRMHGGDVWCGSLYIYRALEAAKRVFSVMKTSINVKALFHLKSVDVFIEPLKTVSRAHVLRRRPLRSNNRRWISSCT